LDRSFLKWAGGKYKSLRMFFDVCTPLHGCFIEPFVGSGVVSLNIQAEKHIIADCNEDLISVFDILKNDTSFKESKND
jgi:DNA adenine methylase